MLNLNIKKFGGIALAVFVVFVVFSGMVPTGGGRNQTAAVFSSSAGCGTLASGESLTPGQSIVSCNGAYTLYFQTDGNVVLYVGTNLTAANALWSTNTAGQSATAFAMQGDGNLVLYNGSTPLWASGSQGGAYGQAGYLDIQDDGNLVVYASSNREVMWASNTAAQTPRYSWPYMPSVFAQGKPFYLPGCNAVGYASTPNLGSLMIGRIMNNDLLNGGCPSGEGAWSLSVVNMDWNTNQVTYLYKALDTSSPVSIEGGAYTVTTAYDPYIAPFQGEYWIAFECAGSGITGGAATCMGPLLWNATVGTLSVDASRISVVAIDTYPNAADPHHPGQTYYHSASDPKLVVHGGQLYLYWSVATIDPSSINYLGFATSDARTHFKRADVRGAQVAKDGAGRMRVVGASGTTSSGHPSL